MGDRPMDNRNSSVSIAATFKSERRGELDKYCTYAPVHRQAKRGDVLEFFTFRSALRQNSNVRSLNDAYERGRTAADYCSGIALTLGSESRPVCSNRTTSPELLASPKLQTSVMPRAVIARANDLG